MQYRFGTAVALVAVFMVGGYGFTVALLYGLQMHWAVVLAMMAVAGSLALTWVLYYCDYLPGEASDAALGVVEDVRSFKDDN